MQQLIKKFTSHFGCAPVIAAAAPGRLEVLGNHTDYNEGFVLSCAVDQTTKFVLTPVPGSKCTVKDFRDGCEMHFDLGALDRQPPRNGSKYIIGMLNELRKRGFKPFAFKAGLESSVPLSAGMSSRRHWKSRADWHLSRRPVSGSNAQNSPAPGREWKTTSSD